MSATARKIILELCPLIIARTQMHGKMLERGFVNVLMEKSRGIHDVIKQTRTCFQVF